MATALRHLRSVLGTLAFAAVLLVGAAMLLPTALGLERYVITGKSMTGSIPRGAVAWEKKVPVGDLRVGDVITYQPPPEARHRGLVTHRVSAVRVQDGQRVFRTKGDANAAADPWTFRLERATQPRVVFHVPVVGYAMTVLADRRARMLLIGLPAALIALVVLAGLVRETAAERRARPRPAIV